MHVDRNDSTVAGMREEHDEMFGLLLAGYASQAVRTLAGLSVAELLEDGELTAQQIAAYASSDPDMTYRVLRAGVALGLLKYDKVAQTFAGTSRLGVLHKNSPFTLKHYPQAIGGPAFWHTSLRLPDSVRRGRNYVEEALGGDLWNFYDRNMTRRGCFARAMTDVSERRFLYRDPVQRPPRHESRSACLHRRDDVCRPGRSWT